MNELREAQKVILKQKTQEAVELFEAEKRKLKERYKQNMVLNAFVCGSFFAMFITSIRDAYYALACVQLAVFAFMAWRVYMEWGYDDDPETKK
jgi:uncharacterized membrane protein YoaK (UPF0700 family)